MFAIANSQIQQYPQIPPPPKSPQIPIPYSWSGDTAGCFADTENCTNISFIFLFLSFSYAKQKRIYQTFLDKLMHLM